MSAEVIWKQKDSEPKKTAHVDALFNLNAAREFYKKKKFPKEWNFQMTKNDSIDNILIWIWWTPPLESKLAKISYPISTHQPRNSFMEELENAYEGIYAAAFKHYETKKPVQQNLYWE
jgi:hypothetical protein